VFIKTDYNRVDVFYALKTTQGKFGGFDKCSCTVTDGAQAIIGHRIGLSGLPEKNEVNCSVLHCIIHQESLFGQVIKQSSVIKTVVKVTNLIRDANKSLSHRKFQAFLEERDTRYSDLLLHSKVRWLRAGKYLE
jgi:hypothetical protein